ncbi:MAG: hypothetical protein V4707_12755 [Pseudomonadota bacterium]
MKPGRDRPPARGGARHAKRNADRKKAYWRLGMAVAVVLAVGAIAVIVRPTPVNALTGCPKAQTAPDAHTVILIDETDRLARNELRFVRDLVMTEYMWLPIGGRLTVRNILSDPAEGDDITVCRIASNSSTGGLLDNERNIRKRFEKIAGARMAALFEGLAAAPEQDASPLMESIAVTLQRSDFDANTEARRLVVVSDFAQHSDLYSMYGRQGLPPLSDEAEEELHRDMAGVDVRLQYVRRRDLAGLQGKAHRGFWSDYFEPQEPKSFALGHGLLIGEATDRETYLYETSDSR